jgi:hypothetical protein
MLLLLLCLMRSLASGARKEGIHLPLDVVAESIFIMSAAVGATAAERMDSGALALMEKLSHLSTPAVAHAHTLYFALSDAVFAAMPNGVISIICDILLLPACAWSAIFLLKHCDYDY